MDDWIAHTGTECPLLDPDDPTVNPMVYIRYRNGYEVGPVPAKSRRWKRWPKSVGTNGLSAFDVKWYKVA